MNAKEHLLVCLNEECCEVGQIVDKILPDFQRLAQEAIAERGISTEANKSNEGHP